MQNKVNEWQELSQKKDIEKIYRILFLNHSNSSAIIFEISIAVLSVLIDQLFDLSTEWKWIVYCIAIILVVYPIITISYNFIRACIIRRNSPYTLISKDDAIDLFDNKICYYVLTAEAYYRMLIDNIGKQEVDIIGFYFIETWYYLNKTKAQLARMRYKTNKIFSSDTANIISENLISISRLLNVIDIIENISKKTSVSVINGLIEKKGQEGKLKISDTEFDLNKEYDGQYESFINEVCDIFGEETKGININFCASNRYGK